MYIRGRLGLHCPSALFVFPVQMCSNISKAVTDPYQHLPTFCVKLLTDDIPIFAALLFALLWITTTIVLMVMIWIMMIMKWIMMSIWLRSCNDEEKDER